jgi:hypothetical protein
MFFALTTSSSGEGTKPPELKAQNIPIITTYAKNMDVEVEG